MKIEFKNTPEQVALIKAMASNNKVEAAEAQEAFAAFLSPLLQEVLLHAGSSAEIFSDEPYNEDDSPSYPIDPLYGNANYGDVSIWSQTVGGGLPTNEFAGSSEIKLRTYDLDTAFSFDKRYARRARLNPIARYVEYAINQLVVKQERNAWSVIMKVLADASTNGVKHTFRAGVSDAFLPNDISNLWTMIRRQNTDYLGGTPMGATGGLTDIYVSPEIKGQIRGFAYNPVNTKAGVVTGGAGVTSVTLPEEVRSQIYRSAGTSEIFGVVIHELLELGVGRRYNELFDFFSSGNIDVYGGTGGSAFANASDELLIGFDLARGAFLRPVETYDDNGGQIQTFVDDQFQARAQKLGWYAKLREGRVCIDSKAVCGLVV
jgi:hypothetical protein